MGRPKCFNEEDVLDAAIDCFWRNGLKASSIRTLSEEMGIAGPSLYNAYGSKESLFTKSLERYANVAMRPRFERLKNTAPLTAIREFLQESVENAVNDADHKGCLFVNTAIETASTDSPISMKADRYLDEVKEFFQTNLESAKAQGDLPEDANLDEIREMLFVVVMGLCVRARTNPARAELEAAIAPALSILTTKQ